MRCCSAWKLPIGLPNWFRVFMYASVSARVCRAMPSSSAAWAMRVMSFAVRSAIRAGLPLAKKCEGSTRVPENVSVASKEPSIRRVLVQVMPPAFAGTQTKQGPVPRCA